MPSIQAAPPGRRPLPRAFEKLENTGRKKAADLRQRTKQKTPTTPGTGTVSTGTAPKATAGKAAAAKEATWGFLTLELDAAVLDTADSTASL